VGAPDRNAEVERMTSRAEDALLDLLNEKNRIIEALEQQLVGHGIPPTLLPAPTPEES
jgi:hypothetical protein